MPMYDIAPFWNEMEIIGIVDQILDSIEGNITDTKIINTFYDNLTPSLVSYLPTEDLLSPYHSGIYGSFPITLIPSKRPRIPGCPKVIFIVCNSSNFGLRAIEALHIASECGSQVMGVMFLTLSWNIKLESSINQVCGVLKKFGVRSIIRKEALARSPIHQY